MERVRIADVDRSVQPAAVMRPLTDALGTTDVAINYYELEPGDSFAFAYHRHEVQEEVFYVQSGTATFETEDGAVTVDAGELIRFVPGEFQRGWNRGDERTDHDLERAEGGDAVVAICTVCGERNGRWTVEGNPPGN